MNAPESVSNTGASSRGQYKLLALIFLAAAPVAIAAYMYFAQVGLPASTTNKGNFIIPPLSSELLGIDQLHKETAAFQQLDGHRKWVILLVAKGLCEQRCEQALYNARQVNIALGKDSDRVGRLLLFTEADVQLENVLAEHPELVRQSVNQDRVDELIAAVAAHDLSLENYDMLLMDPLGNIMMHYKADQDGRDLLDDLKRLLKVSKIG